MARWEHGCGGRKTSNHSGLRISGHPIPGGVHTRSLLLVLTFASRTPCGGDVSRFSRWERVQAVHAAVDVRLRYPRRGPRGDRPQRGLLPRRAHLPEREPAPSRLRWRRKDGFSLPREGLPRPLTARTKAESNVRRSKRTGKTREKPLFVALCGDEELPLYAGAMT